MLHLPCPADELKELRQTCAALCVERYRLKEDNRRLQKQVETLRQQLAAMAQYGSKVVPLNGTCSTASGRQQKCSPTSENTTLQK